MNPDFHNHSFTRHSATRTKYLRGYRLGFGWFNCCVVLDYSRVLLIIENGLFRELRRMPLTRNGAIMASRTKRSRSSALGLVRHPPMWAKTADSAPSPLPLDWNSLIHNVPDRERAGFGRIPPKQRAHTKGAAANSAFLDRIICSKRHWRMQYICAEYSWCQFNRRLVTKGTRPVSGNLSKKLPKCGISLGSWWQQCEPTARRGVGKGFSNCSFGIHGTRPPRRA